MGGRKIAVRLVRRIPTRNKQNLVEFKELEGVLGEDEMTGVNRIETPSKNSKFSQNS